MNGKSLCTMHTDFIAPSLPTCLLKIATTISQFWFMPVIWPCHVCMHTCVHPARFDPSDGQVQMSINTIEGNHPETPNARIHTKSLTYALGFPSNENSTTRLTQAYLHILGSPDCAEMVKLTATQLATQTIG
ncbi:hypothetical protein RB195_025562 [Necator americanus]|uniref:Uncharacterized protein n=1 Tax=Necator americanus TaxID=51031 RepID=A0ABR1ESV2_NECAM